MAVQKNETRAAPATYSFHYLDSVYFQDGQWLTGVLTGILYVILAAALDAAGHVSNLAIVVPVTVGAYLLGVLMSFSRFDGFFALSHSPSTCAALGRSGPPWRRRWTTRPRN